MTPEEQIDAQIEVIKNLKTDQENARKEFANLQAEHDKAKEEITHKDNQIITLKNQIEILAAGDSAASKPVSELQFEFGNKVYELIGVKGTRKLIIPGIGELTALQVVKNAKAIKFLVEAESPFVREVSDEDTQEPAKD